MRRSIVSVAAALTVLAVCSLGFGQGEQKKAVRRENQQQVTKATQGEPNAAVERRKGMSEEERALMRSRLESRLQGVDRKAQLKELEDQISELKAEHEGLVGELNAIRELAAKAKASEAVARIEKLISKQRETFQEKLRRLEQRHQGLQRAVGERAGRKEQGEAAGRKAPDFTLKSFEDKTVKLSDYKGKIVVLEWLNFECPFSKYHYEKVSTMMDLAKKYKSKGVVWLAVNSTSHTTPEANRQFAEQFKVPYPILDDRTGQVGHAYGAKTTPHMFVIDTNGNIVYDGAIDNSPMGKQKEGAVNYVDKSLAELVAGKSVSTAKTEPYGCTVKYPQ